MVQFSPNELQAGGGSGLGLFITRAIVNKHGGSVGFESEGLGQGCNFFFNMPVFTSVSGASEQSGLEHSLARALSFTSKAPTRSSPLLDVTILICDDSDLTRKMLKKVLLGMGCTHCFEAKNGLEAVQMTEDRLKTAAKCSAGQVLLSAFDLILLDDNMPVMQGPEAARRMRELGYSNRIIGVTGNLATEDVAHFVQSGADAVLGKPLDTSELVKVLLAMGDTIVAK